MRFAQRIYDGVKPHEQTIARNIFVRITSPGDGVSDTRRRVPRGDLYPVDVKAGTVDRVIERLSGEDARLIVAGDEGVEVTHESLLREWDALTSGEPRSFPYIGNVPTRRWRPEDPFRFENALGALLIQVLKTVNQKARLERRKRLYGIADDQLALTAPPELLIAYHWRNQGLWRPGDNVIYPDPPLGEDELALVSGLTAPGGPVCLITLTMLPQNFEATR